ncbi:hypothetical protein SKAU_G00084970 [Synaphobranchus kaupii]|uniref:Uncharacterized protein n=1 Tax=Synaphobranchus kaupii TaxID=118154 RepID=A0A9Q1FV86_SYNKA|nr:hypothetical protein SKAU_G00084970 [Synaphobranchus kaupii]
MPPPLAPGRRDTTVALSSQEAAVFLLRHARFLSLSSLRESCGKTEGGSTLLNSGTKERERESLPRIVFVVWERRWINTERRLVAFGGLRTLSPVKDAVLWRGWRAEEGLRPLQVMYAPGLSGATPTSRGGQTGAETESGGDNRPSLCGGATPWCCRRTRPPGGPVKDAVAFLSSSAHLFRRLRSQQGHREEAFYLESHAEQFCTYILVARVSARRLGSWKEAAEPVETEPSLITGAGERFKSVKYSRGRVVLDSSAVSLLLRPALPVNAGETFRRESRPWLCGRANTSDDAIGRVPG